MILRKEHLNVHVFMLTISIKVKHLKPRLQTQTKWKYYSKVNSKYMYLLFNLSLIYCFCKIAIDYFVNFVYNLWYTKHTGTC